MRYLIVNADDFGLTEGVSKGILEACEFGVVRSVTMFANSPLFEREIPLLKEQRRLGIGVHLNLTHGHPVCQDVPSLINKKGSFFRYIEFKSRFNSMKSEDIEKEFTAQIEKISNAGIELTHLDSHHQIHKIPRLHDIVMNLAIKYGIGMRKTENPCPGVKTTEFFTEKFHNENATELGFKMLVKKYEKMDSLEIMCHPGYSDAELISKSDYAKKRNLELSALLRYELQAHLDRLGIKLINYGELPG